MHEKVAAGQTLVGDDIGSTENPAYGDALGFEALDDVVRCELSVRRRHDLVVFANVLHECADAREPVVGRQVRTPDGAH